ncbi:hypothetical protein BMJ25_28050 [Sinorhizobium medicae]|nr:hypothetical protein BMJ25_28050 [Sinorhizobium medicae]
MHRAREERLPSAEADCHFIARGGRFAPLKADVEKKSALPKSGRRRRTKAAMSDRQRIVLELKLREMTGRGAVVRWSNNWLEIGFDS